MNQNNVEVHPDPKEKIITAIKECAFRLGHRPNFEQFSKECNIGRGPIRRLFGSYREALLESGFEPPPEVRKLSPEQLFLDWAGIVRTLGEIPTRERFKELSRYTPKPLLTRFGKWTAVANGMLKFAEENNLSADWADVFAIVRADSNALGTIPRGLRPAPEAVTMPLPGLRTDSPQYGEPLGITSLLSAPTNEMGVVFLFGAMAWQLGFAVLRLQAAFPDCEALRRMHETRWQIVRIEFEFESRNFQAHGHDPDKCDLIVCWKNNWPESPVEVLELSKFFVK